METEQSIKSNVVKLSAISSVTIDIEKFERAKRRGNTLTNSEI